MTITEALDKVKVGDVIETASLFPGLFPKEETLWMCTGRVEDRIEFKAYFLTVFLRRVVLEKKLDEYRVIDETVACL